MSNDCQKEETLKEIKKDIENLYITKEIVIELKTLVSMQIEQNKKQDDILKQQSELLFKITETVAQLKEVQDKLTIKYEDLDSKLIQKSYDDLKASSVSFNAIISTFIDKALPPIIIAGLTYFILEVTGKI